MRPVEPNIKRKNTSPLRVIVNQWGCLFGLLMLGLGGAMGLLGAIFTGPQLLGFDVTATALSEKEIVLAATQVELDVQAQSAISRATEFALDVQATQAILNNDQDLLAQTATQSAQNINATQTAILVGNLQRQTQIANDFTGTQAALNANATQVDIDFRNTQAALGIDNTTSSQNIVPTPAGRYAFDFSQFDPLTNTSIVWKLSSVSDWQATGEGILAMADTAYLIETSPQILPSQNFGNQYRILFDINPAVTMSAGYWLIFGFDGDEGLALHFSAETLNVSQAGLYRFTANQLENGLTTDELSIIRRNAADVSLNSDTQLSLEIIDNALLFAIDDSIVMEMSNMDVPLGAIGIQLPAQATLREISIRD